MPRFDKLEIPSGKPAPGHAPAGPPDRTDESAWMRQADEQRRRGLYENALRYYSRALELERSLVLGWLGQVQMLIQLEECVEAELWSRKALELFPHNGELLAGRAQALCRAGDLKGAHVACDGSLQQQSQSAYRWQVRGELMLAGKQDVERHCFDKARQIDADWLVSLESALIYMHYGRYSRALDRARQAVESGPEQFYAWQVQGQCERELGLATRARRSFEHCLELNPGHVEVQQWMKETAGGFSPFRLLRRLWRR